MGGAAAGDRLELHRPVRPSEMQLTKERFRKTDGRQYYHFVQSFREQDDLTPQEAHAIGLELAQREFP